MKQALQKLLSLRLLLVTALLASVFSGARADESTLTFSAKCEGSGTADDGTAWTVTSDGLESTFDNTKGIHYGTGSSAVQYIKLSTSAIEGTISKIVVNASTASNVSATVDVTVGGSSFGGNAQTLSSNATDYTFVGSASGEIIVTVTKPSKVAKALYVKSVVVTYQKNGDPSKQNPELSFAGETNDYTVNIGETFNAPQLSNPHSLDVVFMSSNTEVASVEPSTGVVTIAGTGQTTISAMFRGNDSYNEGSASYTLTVVDPNANDGSAEKPYTVSEAIDYISTLGTSSSPEDVYVKGIISQIDSYNSSYKSITYWISEDGTTSTQMEVYSGKGLNSADFSSKDDIVVGAEVLVCGKVKSYNSTPEFDKNNYLVSYKAPTVAVEKPVFTPEGGTFIEAQNVTLTCATDGASIKYSFDNQTWQDYTSAIAISETTTIYAKAVKDNDESAVAEATYTIKDPNAPGTANNPYTVAQAIAAIDAAGQTTVPEVYATGIVSKIVTAYNSEFGNITYNISEDGTEEADQLQAYRGFDKDGAWFTSADDVQVGDVVVIYGNLKKHNQTYEFDANNQRVSFTRTSQPTLEEAGLVFIGTTSEYTLTLGDAFEAPELSNPNDLAVTYSSSNETVATVNAQGAVTILAAGTTTITASSEANDTYKAGSASYTITVNNPDAPAAETIEFDFTANDWGFPEGSSNKTNDVSQYSNRTYTITVAGDGTNGYYYNATDNYLIFGKSGAYITLPAFDFAVQKIEVVGRSGASTKVVQNIFVGETAVSSETTGATDTNTYMIDEAYQAAGNIYTLKVTSAHNSQVTKIIVYKGANDDRLDPEIKFLNADGGELADEVQMNVNQELPVSLNTVMTSTEGITVTSDKEEVATYEKGFILALAEGTAKITATFAGNEVYKPVTVTKTITVVDSRQEVTLSFTDVPASINVNETATYTATDDIATMDIDVTYTSDNEEVVMVDEKSGEITAIAVGTATITATFTGNESYKAATASYTIEVVDPSLISNYIALVAPYDGKYFAMNSSLGAEEVDVVNGKVVSAQDNDISWIISPATEASTSKVKIQNVATKKYLCYANSTTLSTKDASTNWDVDAENNSWLNNTTRSMIYRETADGFKNYSVTNIGKDDYATDYTHAYTFASGYVRDVASMSSTWGTICLPSTVEAEDVTGAKFYSIVGKKLNADGAPASLILEEETDGLLAGVPYIFEVSEGAQKIVAAYQDDFEDAGSNNGLVGSLKGCAVETGKYLLSGGKIILCGEGCSIAGNRAYIDMDNVPEYKGDATGSNLVKLNVGTDADGIATLENGTTKGGEPIFNLSGQRINHMSHGVYVVGGRKVFVR